MTVAGGAPVPKHTNPIKARSKLWTALGRILRIGVFRSETRSGKADLTRLLTKQDREQSKVFARND